MYIYQRKPVTLIFILLLCILLSSCSACKTTSTIYRQPAEVDEEILQENYEALKEASLFKQEDEDTDAFTHSLAEYITKLGVGKIKGPFYMRSEYNTYLRFDACDGSYIITFSDNWKIQVVEMYDFDNKCLGIIKLTETLET